MTKRVLANVALSYVAAGIVTIVFLVILELLTPSSIGNMLTGWVYEMCLLAWGSPAVLVVLAIVDLALTAVGNRRRSGFVFSLLPGALAAPRPRRACSAQDHPGRSRRRTPSHLGWDST